MENKEDIVKQFAKYCAQCHGMCCKRGVFTVFGWEAERLTNDFNDFKLGQVSEVRGTCKDIAINKLCIFSKENGCKLSIEHRPTDCLTYPFYPKVGEVNGGLKINSLVVAKECPYSKEIAKDKKLIKAVNQYWGNLIKETNRQGISDWIGNEGSWSEWYSDTIEVKVDFRKQN